MRWHPVFYWSISFLFFSRNHFCLETMKELLIYLTSISQYINFICFLINKTIRFVSKIYHIFFTFFWIKILISNSMYRSCKEKKLNLPLLSLYIRKLMLNAYKTTLFFCNNIDLKENYFFNILHTLYLYIIYNLYLDNFNNFI